MPISDRWGAMAMVLGSSCVLGVGSVRCCVGLWCASGASGVLPVLPAPPTPHLLLPLGWCLAALSAIERPDEGNSRLTTTCSGGPSPETRDAVVITSL